MNAILQPYRVLTVTDEASFRRAIEAYLGDPNATEWLPGPVGSPFVAIAYKIVDSPFTAKELIQKIVDALKGKNGSLTDRGAESRISAKLDTDQMTVHWWREGIGGNAPPKTAWPILLSFVEDEELGDELIDNLRRRIATHNGNGSH
jgi:hypothetical protein